MEEYVKLVWTKNYWLCTNGTVQRRLNGVFYEVNLDENSSGYFRLQISFNGETRKPFVHHLVLIYFIGHRPISYDGSHLDGDRKNNCIFNLMWEPSADNQARRVIHVYLRKAGVATADMVVETAKLIAEAGSIPAAAAKLKPVPKPRKATARKGVKPAEPTSSRRSRAVRLGKTEKAGVVKIPAVACDEETTAPLGASPAGTPAPSAAT